MLKRRVVVTGVGLVTALGVGSQQTWLALLKGESGIGPISRFDTTNFPTTIAGEESCGETGGWTTGPETVDVAIADPIYLFEAGRHDAPQCYDQLTFRLNGPADVGYYATYAESNVMRMEGDQSFTVAGDAALVVDIGAPVGGGPFDTSGHAPLLVFARTIGATLYPSSNPRGLKVIREVRFGGEYEAYGQFSSLSSFVIGVDRQRPFAVSSFVDEISNARVVVVRVAHRPA